MPLKLDIAGLNLVPVRALDFIKIPGPMRFSSASVSTVPIFPERTNLLLEYLADGFASDGSSQPDTSGNFNNATQSTTGLRPSKQANASGGHASIKFTGSQWMSLTTPIAGTGEVTIYIVQKRSIAEGLMVSLADGTSSSLVATPAIEYVDDTQYWQWNNTYVGASGAADTVFRVITCRCSSGTLNQWINGQLQSNNVSGGTSAGDLTTLGRYLSSFLASGELLGVAVYSVAHDNTTRVANENSAAAAFAIRNLIFVGNSITYGYLSTTPGGITGTSYPAAAFAALKGSATSFKGVNLGVSGKSVASMRTDAPTNVDPMLFGGGRIFFEGMLNDIFIGGATPDTSAIIANYLGFITDRIAAGWIASQIRALTCHAILYPSSVSWAADPNPSIDTINAAILANASSIGYGVIDIRNDLILNDPSNFTYRAPDGEHFIDAGYARYGAFVAANF